MGTYATTTSLQTLMIGIEFDTATTSLATKLITHAENEVDKYLSKRYDVSSFHVTSTAVPPLVTSLCETLAEGYMYQRLSRGGKEAMERGSSMVEMAVENLQKIADRELDLVDSDGDPIDEAADASYQILSSAIDYTPTFDEDDELSWAVDQDKLDDIESERD